jgi:pimeloyl-ACP methyl ester carboxylesterase
MSTSISSTQNLAAASENATGNKSRRNQLLLALGAGLAAAALVVRQKTRQAERDNPPLGQFIEVDDVRLHYIERGQGQPLVLLHGNGSMIEDYVISGLVDMAAANYRVIAFDRPGHGHSTRGSRSTPKAQAGVLHKALQQLGIEHPIVVGHSWGTLVALSMALEHPGEVRGLVLLSGYYFPTMRLDVLMAAPPAIPVLGALLRYTISPLMGRMMWPLVKKMLFGPAKVASQFSRFPVWMALRPSQLRASAVESLLMVPSAIGLRHRYPELTMPLVIMAGSGDLVANALDQSGRLHDLLPRSELRLAAGAGHMVHQLVPQEVMAAIDAAEAAAQKKASLVIVQPQAHDAGHAEDADDVMLQPLPTAPGTAAASRPA